MVNKYKNFKYHFLELKKRLLHSCILFLVIFFINYIYAENLYNFAVTPLLNLYNDIANHRIIYTGLAEVFFTYIKLSFIFSLFLSLPFLFYNLYSFVAPGLYKREKKILLLILSFSPILFFLGCIVVYYLVLPLSFKFFLSFQINSDLLPLELEAKISEYINLFLNFIFAFGLAFQLPILLLLLLRAKILDIATLTSKRKYFFITILIVAAIITPPDVVSQIILAIPMIILYEVTIMIAKKMLNVRASKKLSTNIHT